MTPKKEISKWIKKIEKRMAGVAAERDKLDDAISEMETLKESCNKAYDSLQSARDSLSELV